MTRTKNGALRHGRPAAVPAPVRHLARAAAAAGGALVTGGVYRWIRVEETHLADRFGAADHAWRERTPRWFRAPG